jgi:hypothetical protein
MMMMITIVMWSLCSVYVLDVMVKNFLLGDRTGVNDSGENLESGSVDCDTV